MGRRIKYFAGQHETQPIKDPKEIDALYIYFMQRQNYRMNKQLHRDILDYISKYNLSLYDYLFRGQMKYFNDRSYIYPINRQRGYRIIHNAGEAIGIPYTFGLHSLRKTYGYQYIKNGGNVLTLMKMYNHDSPDVTLRYVQWGREDAEHDRKEMYIGPGKHKKIS